MCDDSASAPIGEEKKEVVLRVKKISTLPLPTVTAPIVTKGSFEKLFSSKK